MWQDEVFEDNGVGFTAQPAGSENTASTGLTGNGLANMAHRAKTLNGHASINSTPGNGTTLTWTIPL